MPSADISSATLCRNRLRGRKADYLPDEIEVPQGAGFNIVMLDDVAVRVFANALAQTLVFNQPAEVSSQQVIRVFVVVYFYHRITR